VSVIAIQSEAGQALLPDQPERAAAVLATIGDAARDALTELRRLLGVLRDVDHDTSSATTAVTEPQPGLHHLDDLVARVRDAGVAVDLTVEGTHDEPLPDGVDLSAYRIVQEALTNVLKHSGTARATVIVRYLPDRLDLEICDDGRGAARTNGGHGLVGMRERVDLLGGQLTTGNRPGGGFAVSARLPR
jgi:signal transduction histidine kinase